MASRVADSSSAPAIVGIGTALLLTSTCLVTARITTRLRSGKALQWHDWAIVLAEILAFPQLIFIIFATSHGYGRSQTSVTPGQVAESLRHVFIAQVIWYWSATFVKISVVCLILSLRRTSRTWIIFCYVTLFILTAALLPAMVTQFVACRPYAAYWDPKVRLKAVCWDPRAIAGNVIAFSVIQALTDVVFSFVPLTFLLALQLPLRQRVTISILMGLGLFASATAVARCVIGVTPARDMFRTNADITLLAMLDLHVGIIAATLPTLKAFFEGLLVTLGKVGHEDGSEQEARAVFCKLGLLDATYAPKGVTTSALEVFGGQRR